MKREDGNAAEVEHRATYNYTGTLQVNAPAIDEHLWVVSFFRQRGGEAQQQK